MKLDFSKTKLDCARSIWSYSKVQSIISSLIRNRRVFIPGSLDKFDLINLGCGANIKDGFINIDYSWRPGIHLCWDLANGIPLNAQSVEGAFTEHCLEHLKLSDCRRVLRELSRVLKPSGRVRIIVPDAEMYLDAYAKRKINEAFSAPYYDINEDEITPLMAINRVFRNFGHQYAYDFETLQALLTEAGFINIIRCKFLEGLDARLLIDSEERAIESLYLEAITPPDYLPKNESRLV